MITTKEKKEILRMNTVAADSTGAIRLVVWANTIDEITEDSSYRIENVRLRQFTDREGYTEKYLSSTPETEVHTCADISTTHTLTLPSSTTSYTTIVSEIEAIDNVSKYQKCSNCRNKMTTITNTLSKCTSCDSISLTTKTETTMAVKIRCRSATHEPLHLTVFGDTLTEILDENILITDDDELCEKLLQLGSVKIVYSPNTLIVTEITDNPI